MTKKLVGITDVAELQNLLDDYSPDRPHLSTYGIDSSIYADESELEQWRAKGRITTRASLEPKADAIIGRALREIGTCTCGDLWWETMQKNHRPGCPLNRESPHS